MAPKQADKIENPPTKPLNTVATKPIPPESSTAAKRSLKQADNNEPKKKAKTSSTTEQNALKKGKTEDKITCAKDLDQKAFELSRKIWGSDGVLPAKPRKKKLSKEDELVSTSPKKEVVEVKKTQKVVNAVVVDTHHLSESREMGLFFKAENRTALVDYTAKIIFKNNAPSTSS
ncbi:GLABROUS1 enhancer-binding protein-like [Raphanus sativus]|nr:GLABROUS1 enhancer-binding protein-like [Raphanus sativus]